MHRAFFISILIMLSALRVWGHEDDKGDVHPDVRVEGDKFVVYYSNNVAGYHDGKVPSKSLKTILDKKGKILAQGQEVARPAIKPPHFDPKSGKSVDELVNLAIEASEEKRNTNPNSIYSTFSFDMIDPDDGLDDGLAGVFELGRIARMNQKALAADSIVAVVSPRIAVEKRMQWPLEFHSYDTKTANRIHSASIGIPQRVYSKPRISNIVVHNNHAYVAWMTLRNRHMHLQLSRFNPQTGSLITKRVSDGAGNCDPSINVIGDNMLIAFHVPVLHRDAKPIKLEAEIIYRHVDLAEFFKEP